VPPDVTVIEDVVAEVFQTYVNGVLLPVVGFAVSTLPIVLAVMATVGRIVVTM
jgi:roadblock/LC7 domain-containing protein